ncbi:hypothetical protein LPTSP4_36500 [Leptospira ryugenii]|uniref:Uncharacterized protein n=1 Tax=Leptospira ryugenii TaxID=1917863 RepID=A0A2P2E5H2_9LEPT|nr:hypothetical protein [Leptospira ryugenii]GBF52112.1 hypothetical protein LPTSP4_36500 [Leptospira ryugenii]
MNPKLASLSILVLEDPGYESAWTFFKTMEEFIPELLPTKINTHEPVNKDFCLDSPEEFKKYWRTIIWFQKSRIMEGSIYIKTWRKNHTSFKIEIKLKQMKSQERLLNFFEEASKRLHSDLSVLQYPLKEEHPFRIESESDSIGWEGAILAPIRLRKFLPDLYSCQVFGKSYVDLFGMEKLLSAPAPVVKKLSKDQVYLQLSKNLEKINYEELEENRKLVKKHLGEDAFFQIEKGIDYKYKVPDFPPVIEAKETINISIG